MDNNKSICFKCNVELTTQKVKLSYLELDFNYDMLKCPKCGLVYISEDIVTGKMAEVEKMLEGK